MLSSLPSSSSTNPQGFQMPTFGGNVASSSSSFVGLGGVAGGGASGMPVRTGVGHGASTAGGGVGISGTTTMASSWPTKKDNQSHPVLDTPMPPELVALFEGLKAQIKNHKTSMSQVVEATSNIVKVDSVSDEIDKVQGDLNSLANAVHRQELQTASLINDIEELSKDTQLMTTLSTGSGGYNYRGLSQPVLDFMQQLVVRYSERLATYKGEMERVEASLKTFTEMSSVQSDIKGRDLWASLSTIKDGVIMLAVQVQQLNEGVRKELSVHKSLCDVFGTSTPDWIRNLEFQLKLDGANKAPTDTDSPLKKWLSKTPTPTLSRTGGGGGGATALGPSRAIENLYDQLQNTFGSPHSSTNIHRATTIPVDSSMGIRAPVNLGQSLFTPIAFGSYPQPHLYPSPSVASVIGSYLGPTQMQSHGNPTAAVQSQARSVSFSAASHKRMHN